MERFTFFLKNNKELKDYANPLIQKAEFFSYDDFKKRNRFQNVEKIEEVNAEGLNLKVDVISLDRAFKGTGEIKRRGVRP